jgi:putative Mg2+ transporter-C (MgtC) family protein
MDATRAQILLHLGGALLAGGAVGLERSWHGRPAGFRTHALVCTASALLMMVGVYEPRWIPIELGDAIRIDPTRMAQGIVTGIGFLGAGVIFKEGLTVRGLTAASIWITAAIGILMGVGLYFPAAAGTVLTLGVLTAFRRLERLLPVQLYVHHAIRFARAEVMAEDRLRALLAEQGCVVSDLSQRLVEDGRFFEYRMVLRMANDRVLTRLGARLSALPAVREFTLSPTGE